MEGTIVNFRSARHHQSGNQMIIKVSGYDVTAGEKDSYGWLTGCIHTNKGIIVYG